MKFNDIQIDPIEQLRLLDRVDCEEDLYTFLKMAWPHFEASSFTDGWALDAICEHLQAVTDGQIRRLIINQPPRTGKTNIISAAWPAWTWAQKRRTHTSGPGVEFLTTSYGLKLAREGSDKCRRIIKSDWYQKLFGDRVQIRADKDGMETFANTQNGQRTIRSVGAPCTGLGSSIIICDDVNSASDEMSEVTREGVIEWYQGMLVSRLNDPKLGAIVNVQQRIAEDDITGFLLENQGDDWVHLCLPMRYERDRHCVTSIGWQDPRKDEGELLFPERFGPNEVTSLEKAMGPFRAAGQLQQRPEPKGGGIIKREWWMPWETTEYPPMDYIIASVDTAYTEKKENDPSAMTVWGVFSEDTNSVVNRILDAEGRPMYAERTSYLHAPKLMLMYAWSEHLEFHELVNKVAITAKRLKVDKLLIEGKASGISVAQEIRRLYAHEGFGVQLINPGAQDKVARLYSVQHIFADMIVHAPDKEWAEKTITQVSQFPKSKHKDLTDTVSQAVRHLRDIGMLTRAPERQADLDESLRFRGNEGKQALYPT
jgi:predicted phage terminase large subunit-like protein